MENDDDYLILETGCFYTLYTNENYIKSRQQKARISILNDDSENSFNWTCQNVASLINSFPNWMLSIKSVGNNISKMILEDPQNPKNFFKMKLFPNFTMTVKANLVWIVTNWEHSTKIQKVYADSRNRPLKKAKDQELYFYQLYINIQEDSTFAIFNAPNAVFYPPDSFSEGFNHFCHYLHYHKKLPKSLENLFIYDFISTWIRQPKKEKETTFNSFINATEGFIQFDITPDRPALKKFPLIDHEGQKWRILGGIYISKYAQTIIEKNDEIISGFLLDSTFRAIPSFVCSIIMGSIYNVGVPLAFSFAITESEEVYQRIYDTFLKKLSIDLSKYIFESDQGRALDAFFTKNSIKNLVCNRHLLVSLQKNIFSFQIGNIVKCRNQLDLDTCFCLYSDEFEKFLIDYKEQHGEEAHDDMRMQLNAILEKVGLTFSDKIEIAQKKRWKQVSLYERIKKVMPSTTNSLESSHGHINADVPRRQNFFHSLKKLIKWLNSKIVNFPKLLKKNFKYSTDKAKKKVMVKNDDDMEKECKYYHSTDKKCLCGEIALESQLYRTEMLCSHMIYCQIKKGKKIDKINFPKCPDVKLEYLPNEFSIQKNKTKLTIKYKKIMPKKKSQDYDRDQILLRHAARTIKKYSKCAEKIPLILEFLEKTLTPKIHDDDTFIGSYPLSYYTAVSSGIYKFSGKIEEINFDDDDDDE